MSDKILIRISTHHFFIINMKGDVWSLPLLLEPEKEIPVLEAVSVRGVLVNGLDWTRPLILFNK